MPEIIKLSREDHIKRHKELHKSLDELVADFIDHTKQMPSQITLMEFMNWSCDQTISPTERENDGG